MAHKIRDVMTSNPVILGENDTVLDAARRMREKNIGDVLVQDGNGKLVGILTDRDIVVRALAEGREGSSRVGDVCSKDLETLSPHDDVDEAVRRMSGHAVRRLPVVENGRPVGVVSLGDLAEERDRRSALGRISEAPANT